MSDQTKCEMDSLKGMKLRKLLCLIVLAGCALNTSNSGRAPLSGSVFAFQSVGVGPYTNWRLRTVIAEGTRETYRSGYQFPARHAPFYITVSEDLVRQKAELTIGGQPIKLPFSCFSGGEPVPQVAVSSSGRFLACLADANNSRQIYVADFGNHTRPSVVAKLKNAIANSAQSIAFINDHTLVYLRYARGECHPESVTELATSAVIYDFRIKRTRTHVCADGVVAGDDNRLALRALAIGGERIYSTDEGKHWTSGFPVVFVGKSLAFLSKQGALVDSAGRQIVAPSIAAAYWTEAKRADQQSSWTDAVQANPLPGRKQFVKVSP